MAQLFDLIWNEGIEHIWWESFLMDLNIWTRARKALRCFSVFLGSPLMDELLTVNWTILVSLFVTVRAFSTWVQPYNHCSPAVASSTEHSIGIFGFHLRSAPLFSFVLLPNLTHSLALYLSQSQSRHLSSLRGSWLVMASPHPLWRP